MARASRPRRTPRSRLLALPAVRRLMAACVVLGVLVWALVVAQWTLVAGVVAAIFSGGRDPGEVVGPLAGVVLVWSARSALVAVRERLAAATSTRVRQDLRRELARTVLRVGPGPLSGERVGELVVTATDGVTKLDAFVARALPASATAAVVPALVALTVLVLDPPSGVLLLLTGPVVVVFLWLVGTRAAEVSAQQWAALGQLGALLVDTVRVLPTLVAYGRGRSAAGWLTEVSEGYRRTTMRVLRTAFLSGFVLELGATLCTALVAVTVGVRLFEGDLDLERALLVLLLTPEFFAPLRALGADHHASLEGRPAAERVFALLDLPTSSSGSGRVAPGVPHVRLRGVTVRHDGARHDGARHEVLSAVDLDLPPLSRTALVGPSGAGKSTAAQLLLGFRFPDDGEVLVDGVPLATLDIQAWRSRVAYVPERPYLLPGTVADNVRLGRADASPQQVEDALARAHALDFVRRLPDGVQTRVGEDGAFLSGGERLRLALARAFVKDAVLVVLDEPTSQLDDGSEAAVLAALDEVAQGRTLLTVTHRAAPLGIHDRVVHLADGRVREPEVTR